MDKRGFTLIEVLVVLIIMAILVGTAVTSLSAGLKSAHMRDAARAVQQYVRHAKAVALLKQRPVVITFEEVEEHGEFTGSRVSLTARSDAKADAGATPLGSGFTSGGGGRARTLLWRPEDDLDEPEAPPPAPVSAAAQSAAAGIEEDDPLSAPPRVFEGIHIRAERQEERTDSRGGPRARNSSFSNADFLLGEAAAEKAKERAAAREKAGEDPEDADASDGEKKEKDEDASYSAVYEANGRCDPYVVRVWKDGEDESTAMTISVGRFGRAVTGD